MTLYGTAPAKCTTVKQTRALRSFGLGRWQRGCFAWSRNTLPRKPSSLPFGTEISSSSIANTPVRAFSSNSSVSELSTKSVSATTTPCVAYSCCSSLKMCSLKWFCSFSLQ